MYLLEWDLIKELVVDFLDQDQHMAVPVFQKILEQLLLLQIILKQNLSIVKAVIKSNDKRRNLLLNRVFEIMGNKINKKIITFLGVTFKPNTDDMREASSLKMIPLLIKKGAYIRYYDPSGIKKEFKKYKK